jgi:predicted acetyltransferase
VSEHGVEATIRAAVPSDIQAVAALWCEAFPSQRTVADRARMLETGGRYGGLESVLVARDAAAALVGACKIYRLTQYITAVAMPMMGLAAVAVAPWARRQGLGARLCAHAIERARDRGDVLSALYPFRPDYYERLGWGLVGELHEYRFHTAALVPYDEARHVRTAQRASDADAIAACYARLAARSTGPIERDARAWAYRLADEELGVRPVAVGSHPDALAPGAAPRGRVVVYDHDGVTGYALLRGGRPGRSGRAVLHVRELLAETEEAYRGILGYIAGRADRWPVTRHAARSEERFGDRLSDPRPPGSTRARSLYFPTARIIRGPMLRILDVPRALGLRRYFLASPGDDPREAVIEIEVDDDQVPANRGPWVVRIQGGAATVAGRRRGDGAESPAGGQAVAARLRADTASLARVFVGDVAPGELYRVARGHVQGDIRLLNAAFATRERFWLLDEF